MIRDTCSCGAKFESNHGGMYGPSWEHMDHVTWLEQHKACRTQREEKK